MSPIIFVCVRVRDEELRIAQFCKSYQDADLILVADGGSVDDTKKIAKTFPNVIIRDYPGREEMANGYWRNNDSDHANFLFEWAYSLRPDWIIYDDCDCRPNYLLRNSYRKIFSETDADVVMAVRMYLWGLDQHFPALSSPLGEEKGQPSLYAWRGSLDLWTVNVPPAYTFRAGTREIRDFRIDTKCLDLVYPYCLLHYSWDDPDRVEEKVKIYRESGLIPTMLHPLKFGGGLAPLPEFAHE